MHPMPIKGLEGAATSCNALSDANAVQHRAGCPVPLGEHQHGASPEGLDGLFQLWRHCLAAETFSRKTRLQPATFSKAKLPVSNLGLYRISG
jgi:hypothetical protein